MHRFQAAVRGHADRFGPRLPLTLGAALVATSHAGLALTMPLMRLWDDKKEGVSR